MYGGRYSQVIRDFTVFAKLATLDICKMPNNIAEARLGFSVTHSR
jgi:hypothetical protein